MPVAESQRSTRQASTNPLSTPAKPKLKIPFRLQLAHGSDLQTGENPKPTTLREVFAYREATMDESLVEFETRSKEEVERLIDIDETRNKCLVGLKGLILEGLLAGMAEFEGDQDTLQLVEIVLEAATRVCVLGRRGGKMITLADAIDLVVFLVVTNSEDSARLKRNVGIYLLDEGRKKI